MEDFLSNGPKRSIDESVHIAAAALKYFVREIPQGLWKADWFHNICDYAESHDTIPSSKDDALLKLIRKETHEMPYPSYVITKILFYLLKLVNEQSSINLMNSSNLLIIWGPNLVKVDDPSMIVTLTKPDSWVGIMGTYFINYYDEVFIH
eukprot:NODE_1027_length_1997_cov_0.506322.p2 type:complete len:150 gc:universal NODE_1027_length_1997_cov_0.506322:817-368(-)